MSDSIWDDPDLAADGDYVKFENVGDGVRGTITGLSIHTWGDGTRCPKIAIRDDAGNDRTWTVGQANAQAKLREQRPTVGMRIVAVLQSIEKRDGGKTLKHIDVATGHPTNAAPPPPAAPVADLAPAAAAVAAAPAVSAASLL